MAIWHSYVFKLLFFLLDADTRWLAGAGKTVLAYDEVTC